MTIYHDKPYMCDYAHPSKFGPEGGMYNIPEFKVLNVTGNNRYLTLEREYDTISINKHFIVEIGHGFKPKPENVVLVTTHSIYRLIISEPLLEKLLSEV